MAHAHTCWGHCKASESQGDHPFLSIKKMFGASKVRCHDLSKNENRLALLPGFANVMRAEACLV